MSVPIARITPQMQNLGWDSSAREVNLLVRHQLPYSSLATTCLDKKDFFAIIPSVINSILHSMNKCMKCQVHKVTALCTHTKQLVSFF